MELFVDILYSLLLVIIFISFVLLVGYVLKDMFKSNFFLGLAGIIIPPLVLVYPIYKYELRKKITLSVLLSIFSLAFYFYIYQPYVAPIKEIANITTALKRKLNLNCTFTGANYLLQKENYIMICGISQSTLKNIKENQLQVLKEDVVEPILENYLSASPSLAGKYFTLGFNVVEENSKYLCYAMDVPNKVTDIWQENTDKISKACTRDN